jgi:plasmid stabilization system protein ParE
MSFDIQLSKSAKTDLINAIHWYEDKVPGLGNRFKNSIQKGIETLKKNPTIFQFQYDEIRVLFLKKFPFSVHYKVDMSKRIVLIIAFFHTSQNSDLWENRDYE